MSYTSQVRRSRPAHSLKVSRHSIATGVSSLAPILPHPVGCGAHRMHPMASLDYPSSCTVPVWMPRSRTRPCGSQLPALKLPPSLCLGQAFVYYRPCALPPFQHALSYAQSTAWAGRTCLPTPSGSACLVPGSLRCTFCTAHSIVDHPLNAHVLHLSLGCTHHCGDAAHWESASYHQGSGHAHPVVDDRAHSPNPQRILRTLAEPIV